VFAWNSLAMAVVETIWVNLGYFVSNVFGD
jgi:hypothetical protein